MLSEKEIQEARHASRVLPLAVPNPHGPLGLEQLAETVERATRVSQSPTGQKVQRPLTLPLETWEKLDGLARAATRPGSRPFSASDVAAALIERSVKVG